jgi:hypothetical protein
MKKLSILIFAVMAALLLSACGGNRTDPELVGRWEEISSEVIVYGESSIEEWDASIEFFSDGKGTELVDGKTYNFTWTARDGRLSMTFGEDNEVEVYEYTVTDATLTLTVKYANVTHITTYRIAERTAPAN